MNHCAKYSRNHKFHSPKDSTSIPENQGKTAEVEKKFRSHNIYRQCQFEAKITATKHGFIFENLQTKRYTETI